MKINTKFLVLLLSGSLLSCTKQVTTPSLNQPEKSTAVDMPVKENIPSNTKPKRYSKFYDEVSSSWAVYCSGIENDLQDYRYRSPTELNIKSPLQLTHSQRSELYSSMQAIGESLSKCWEAFSSIIPLTNRIAFLEVSADQSNTENLIKFDSSLQYSKLLLKILNLKDKTKTNSIKNLDPVQRFNDKPKYDLLHLSSLFIYSQYLDLYWPIMILQNPAGYKSTVLMSVQNALSMNKKEPLKQLSYLKYLVKGVIEALDTASTQRLMFAGDLLINPTIAALSEQNSSDEALVTEFKSALKHMLTTNPEFGALLFNTLIVRTATKSADFSVTKFNQSIQDPSANTQEILAGLSKLVSVKKCKASKSIHCFTIDNDDTKASSPEFPVLSIEEASVAASKDNSSEPLVYLKYLQNYWNGILKDLEALESGESTVGIFGRYGTK